VRDTLTVEGEGFEPFTLDLTCIDNGLPLVIFRAADLGRSGYESLGEMNADTHLKKRIDALRLKVSKQMGLGDVSQKNYPKMTLIAPPRSGGSVCTHSFIPHVCHDAIGVLAPVTMATSCVLEGSVSDGIAVMQDVLVKTVSVEHPTGEFSVERRASFMAHHIGDFNTSATWAAICNELCYRVSQLFPDNFIGAAMLPQSPDVDPATCIPELEKCVKQYGFVAINLNPDPSGGHWKEPPLTDRHWYPILREDGQMSYKWRKNETGTMYCRDDFGSHWILFS
jgi:hypothetical protein